MTEVISKPRVIRDKAFAKRLQLACENQPLCPEAGRGQQKWIYDQLLANHGIRVSPEAPYSAALSIRILWLQVRVPTEDSN